MLLPKGYAVTPSQIFLFSFVTQAPFQIFILNAVFWLIYRYEFKVIEQYKIDPQKAWPWVSDPEGWRIEAYQALKSVLFNMTFVNFVFATVVLYFYDWDLPWNNRPEDVPTGLEMAKQLLFLIICDDLTFHLMHRLMHCKHKNFPMYQMFHKLHHKFVYTTSIASLHAHPVEHFFVNNLSWMTGIILLGPRMHTWTGLVWSYLRMIESHEAHCGYEFPWSIFRVLPFGSDASYHSFHHTVNVGNYSTWFTVWDTIFDSNVDYYQVYGGKSEEKTENLK